MVAMLAFGGTFAYFTATATEKSATVKTGKVLLANNEVQLVTGPVVPKMEILKTGSSISVNNTSDVEVYIFVTFAVNFDGAAASTDVLKVNTTDSEFAALTGHDGVYFVKTTKTGELKLTSSITFDAKEDSTDGSEDGLQYMGKTIEVKVSSRAIQAYDFTDEATAYASLS